MAYEVTATRRRPQRFEDLIGQEFVAATLKNSIQSGKIAHAYLFSGPRGCGKTSTARILAKALNCEKGPTPSPCGECSTCQEITKGSSLDVIEIDGASNTSVNDIRQIKDEILFPPNSCRYKIYIIDEVHMLSTNAFNALLKTIEEPPPYVIFIFATTELQKVPATIKSRCQQFNFRLVPVEKIKEQLALAAKEINIEADDEALYWIAREATGSMRDSYTLFDQITAFSENHITYEKIAGKLGLVGTDKLNEIFNECATNNTTEVLNKLDLFLQSGVSIEQIITNSVDYLRSILLLKNGIRKEALLGQGPERYSSTVVESWNPIQIERALSIFLQLYRDIRYSISPRYELELAFSRLSWLKDYTSPSEVKKAIDAARELLAPNMGKATKPNTMQHSDASQTIAPQGGFSQTTPQTNTYQAGNTQPNDMASNTQPSFEQKPTTQESQPLPNNMARFSALSTDSAPSQTYTENTQSDEMPPDESYQGEDYQGESEGASGPFFDGGQLPPDQTTATMSMNELRAKTIATLAVDEQFTASALNKTADWVLDNNHITATIDTTFNQTHLKQQAQLINECISQFYGQQLTIEFKLREEVKIQEKPIEVPEQIDILCKAFRGSIVGGGNQ
jgi:DNA polymerase-3 subunit gamma/tau